MGSLVSGTVGRSTFAAPGAFAATLVWAVVPLEVAPFGVLDAPVAADFAPFAVLADFTRRAACEESRLAESAWDGVAVAGAALAARLESVPPAGVSAGD